MVTQDRGETKQVECPEREPNRNQGGGECAKACEHARRRDARACEEGVDAPARSQRWPSGGLVRQLREHRRHMPMPMPMPVPMPMPTPMPMPMPHAHAQIMQRPHACCERPEGACTKHHSLPDEDDTVDELQGSAQYRRQPGRGLHVRERGEDAEEGQGEELQAAESAAEQQAPEQEAARGDASDSAAATAPAGRGRGLVGGRVGGGRVGGRVGGWAVGTGLPSSEGTTMAATVDMAKRMTPPSCHSCIERACAAAATPVESRVCVVDVTLTKATLSATARSCTAAPPFSSVDIEDRAGTRSIADHRVSFLRSISARNAPPEAICATEVASAAPATPILALKMSIGSSACRSRGGVRCSDLGHGRGRRGRLQQPDARERTGGEEDCWD